MYNFVPVTTTGQDDYGPVRYWPRKALTLHPQKKALLASLASFRGISERLIVEDGLRLAYEALGPTEQKVVAGALGGAPIFTATARVECPEAIEDAVRAFAEWWMKKPKDRAEATKRRVIAHMIGLEID